MNATADGASKNMTVRNGLAVNDTNGGTSKRIFPQRRSCSVGLGYGEINGNGTENSKANITVDTQYNTDGSGQVVVNGDGQAIGQNTSVLNIGGSASLNNTNGMNNCEPIFPIYFV